MQKQVNTIIMKFGIKIFLSILLPISTHAQKYPYYTQPGQNQFDSLQKMLKKASNDTIRMAVYRELSNYFTEVKVDSAYYYDIMKAHGGELKTFFYIVQTRICFSGIEVYSSIAHQF
jgi:hypothetical protein